MLCHCAHDSYNIAPRLSADNVEILLWSLVEENSGRHPSRNMLLTLPTGNLLMFFGHI